ncbi:hypothetical protein QN224_06985 [Sinorhizobium sp. 8-89]|uniref:hypothetical protein n=1 Tax=Sinorhizobium sp. 7-81 TaxID=3049087 RepID=UPI0024C2C53A|nr:hypothetical protein [Sinorhizobium sp. 7-81]MDK1385148.1 hypothetical protein [Sinorhizobium sp. 7-81]
MHGAEHVVTGVGGQISAHLGQPACERVRKADPVDGPVASSSRPDVPVQIQLRPSHPSELRSAMSRERQPLGQCLLVRLEGCRGGEVGMQFVGVQKAR